MSVLRRPPHAPQALLPSLEAPRCHVGGAGRPVGGEYRLGGSACLGLGPPPRTMLMGGHQCPTGHGSPSWR